MKYRVHTLKNGLRIVLAHMPSNRTATVMVMSGTGSRYEDPHENGLAHFLEHMFFKGTKRRPNARAISEELDALGAVYNAFTAKERTAYYAKVSARHLDTALDCLCDIFLNSTLPSHEIKKERGAIIQEIDMYEDMPMRTVGDIFEELVFGQAHPLGRTILGSKDNIRGFSRKDFAEYLKRNYTPLNTIVCVAGDFSERKVLAKVVKEFGKLEHGNPPDFIPFDSEQNAPRVLIRSKKTDQTHFVLGVPSYPYLHKDEYALAVLSTILGGGMSSRLFTEVREKRGLVYSIHTSIDRYPDTGIFTAQAGVEHRNLEKTVKMILAEFKKIKRVKVSAAELAKARSFLKGTLTLALETSDEIANHAASTLINIGRVRPLSEILAGISAVSNADVQRVARDLFKTERLNLAVIGPHGKGKELRALLLM